jgi:hypothetical protein|tara:strand:- start:402 stop:788 length:387 start_codon:yes stop_codon:yes gene_type:complete
MATQIVIGNNDSIRIDDSFHIGWADKGNTMPSLPATIHFVIWNDLPGQNEIQNKDASTGNMTGNTDLNATSDAVGSTTVADLLTWGETRKGEIETAEAAYLTAVKDDYNNGTTHAEGKTWIDYDPNYS